MALISFIKDMSLVIKVDKSKTLMQNLLEHNIAVASSCAGDAVCGKCKIKVLSGIRHLSPINADEIKLKQELGLSSDIRISCQVFVTGDIVIDTDYW